MTDAGSSSEYRFFLAGLTYEECQHLEVDLIFPCLFLGRFLNILFHLERIRALRKMKRSNTKR